MLKLIKNSIDNNKNSINILKQMGRMDGKDFNQRNRFAHVKNVSKLKKFEELYNNIVTDVKNSDDFLLREPHDFIKEGKTKDISEVDYETVEKLENTTDIAYNSIVDKGDIFWKYNKKELYRDDNLINREKIIESLNESGQFDSEITTDYTELSYVNRSDGKVLAFEFFRDSVDDSDGKYIGSGITEFQSYELDSDTGEITPLYTQQINSDQEKMKDAIRSIVYWEKGVTRDNKKNNYY